MARIERIGGCGPFSFFLPRAARRSSLWGEDTLCRLPAADMRSFVSRLGPWVGSILPRDRFPRAGVWLSENASPLQRQTKPCRAGRRPFPRSKAPIGPRMAAKVVLFLDTFRPLLSSPRNVREVACSRSSERPAAGASATRPDDRLVLARGVNISSLWGGGRGRAARKKRTGVARPLRRPYRFFSWAANIPIIGLEPRLYDSGSAKTRFPAHESGARTAAKKPLHLTCAECSRNS